MLNIIILATQVERLNFIKLFNRIFNKGSIADKFDYIELE